MKVSQQANNIQEAPKTIVIMCHPHNPLYETSDVTMRARTPTSTNTTNSSSSSGHRNGGGGSSSNRRTADRTTPNSETQLLLLQQEQQQQQQDLQVLSSSEESSSPVAIVQATLSPPISFLEDMMGIINDYRQDRIETSPSPLRSTTTTATLNEEEEQQQQGDGLDGNDDPIINLIDKALAIVDSKDCNSSRSRRV